MTFSILKSRTFWVSLLLGVYNLGSFYAGMFASVHWLPIAVNALGLILITYFHVNPSQTYNAPPAA